MSKAAEAEVAAAAAAARPWSAALLRKHAALSAPRGWQTTPELSSLDRTLVLQNTRLFSIFFELAVLPLLLLPFFLLHLVM